MRLGVASQKNVIPAAAFEPVRLLTHMPSTMSIRESPNMLVEMAVKRRGKPIWENA